MQVSTLISIVMVGLISLSPSTWLSIADQGDCQWYLGDSVLANSTNHDSITVEFPPIASGFIENQGQLDNDAIRFYAPMDLGGIAFLDSGVLMNLKESPRSLSTTLLVQDSPPNDAIGEWYPPDEDNSRTECTIQLDFEATQRIKPIGRCRLPGDYNFFLGNDPSRWWTGVPSFARVVYQNLYEGIDLVYKWGPSGIKYEFIVAPGVDPGCIEVHVQGHDNLSLVSGDMLVSTAAGVIVDTNLEAFYYDAPWEKVEVRFEVHGSTAFGFNVSDYEIGRSVVIDPLIYSTYLGSSSYDSIESIKVDGAGNTYVTGSTQSTHFPTTVGAHDTDLAGPSDIFVTKLASNGTSLVWSTFIGGSNADACNDLSFDADGNILLGGMSTSRDFPISQGAFQQSHGGGQYDGIVCKLRSDGANLQYSTYLGGLNTDLIYGIAVDGAGNAYCTGSIMQSWNGTRATPSFPTTPGAFCTTKPGGIYDSFVSKINHNGTALIYSTYLGGKYIDMATSIAVDDNRCAYVCGYTSSFLFPSTSRAFQRVFKGQMDAFVTKFSEDGSSLVYSTYLGGGEFDASLDLVLDSSKNAHIVGYTNSGAFPTTSESFQTTKDGNNDGFVSRLSADGSTLVTSTFIGGLENDQVKSVDLDEDGNVLLTGHTHSDDFPTTPRVAQTKRKGDIDLFMTKLNASYKDLLYSTYLGGSQDDNAKGIAPGGRWNVYVAGSTESGDFPTTPGVFQRSYGGGFDGFVVKLTLDTVKPLALAGEDVVIDQHETVEFNGTASSDNLGIANWSWSFTYDDKVITLNDSITNFTFHTAGRYVVTLTVRDVAGNKATDSLNVTVNDITLPVADAGLNRFVLQHETVHFDGGRSTDNVGVVNWTWAFTYLGKGIYLYGPKPSFTFHAAGGYIVTLNVSDEAGNWAIDSVTIHVRDITPPVADAGMDITIDQHQMVTMNGTLSTDNIGVVNWTWSFTYRGDLVTLHEPTPSFFFDDAGSYSVLLIVKDEVGNEATDTVTVEVRDTTKPVVDAGEDQVIDQYQQVVLDSMGSSDNVGIATWRWSFDYEGTPITLADCRSEFFFEAAGVYEVTLKVTDEAGNWATDEIRVTVRDITNPVAVAGGNINIDQHQTVTFDGSYSSDNVGIVEWTWEFECENEVVTLSGVITTYDFHTAGQYVVTLTVWDASRNSATDEVTVIVRDITDPIADAGADQAVDQFATILFDGTASRDNVGIDEWLWRFTYEDAPVFLSGKTETYQFDVPGVYVVTLRVVDTIGNFDETTFTITVRDTIPPEAIWKGDTHVRKGEKMTLDGSASTDNVGVQKWIWTIMGEGKALEFEGAIIDHVFDRAGQYEVTMNVYDAEGNIANETFTVTVESTSLMVGGVSWVWWLVIILIVIAVIIVIKRSASRK